MEFSLCCKFHKEKIAYKIYTLTNIKTLSKEKAREKIYSVVLNNIDSLQLFAAQKQRKMRIIQTHITTSTLIVQNNS